MQLSSLSLYPLSLHVTSPPFPLKCLWTFFGVIIHNLFQFHIHLEIVNRAIEGINLEDKPQGMSKEHARSMARVSLCWRDFTEASCRMKSRDTLSEVKPDRVQLLSAIRKEVLGRMPSPPFRL
ncbi:uncharacterized protein MONOS_6987 [Monocercomonoides exilis]|uniref:uncharacterized protein n=1 Tax=Monocercomonoides exilis TaxID=2049356 RepID=UPI0035594826|nr:hypothetical protein MONOS_6987 [Monocercomonoides exilis]|eukprot:MONOS_6987.1-p1 / transcript=MONOS_6987.1 / gene=MONOS_6987 / organism=Monocercomonoides_exilis_PA203 / gene_product=unspecified product / transcript_product=unspecified product / location=Mono_scaffold00230:21461-22246(-) / protein_length=123 / sequence_SO=supercontig / SO=protein_coding / is_pseudo=false